MAGLRFWSRTAAGDWEVRLLRPPGPAPAAPVLPSQYFLGLDLAKESDYSAVALVEGPPRGGDARPHYEVRSLHRWPLGTRYKQVAADVAQFRTQHALGPDAALIMDKTGLGQGVYEELQERWPATSLISVTITGGQEVVTARWGEYHVPKVELIGRLLVVLQNERLKIAPGLKTAPQLEAELQGYQRRVSRAQHEQYGQWHAGQHDDLVMALALAVWYAEAHGYTQQHWW